MEKKTQLQVLSEIYNETLASLLTQKINRELYEELPDDFKIVPEELVSTGMRVQKTAGTRKKELDEIIETKQKTLDIVDRMIEEEEKKELGSQEGLTQVTGQQNDTGKTGE